MIDSVAKNCYPLCKRELDKPVGIAVILDQRLLVLDDRKIRLPGQQASIMARLIRGGGLATLSTVNALPSLCGAIWPTTRNGKPSTSGCRLFAGCCPVRDSKSSACMASVGGW